jgi:hypothetical protein
MIHKASKPTDEECIDPPGSTAMYLVLHGELAIFDNPKNPYIDIYAPEIAEHVYMAGPWLGEQRIQRGTTLTLTGVKGGTDSLGRLAGSFLIFRGVTPMPVNASIALRVARPRKITPLSLNRLQEDSVTVDPASKVTVLLPPNAKFPPHLAQCCVFEYCVRPGANPKLEQVGGTTPEVEQDWCAGKKRRNGSFSLHVFAESDGTECKPAHAEHSFQRATELLGFNATLIAMPKQAGEPTTAPSDLWPGEIAISLAARVKLLRKFMASIDGRSRIEEIRSVIDQVPPDFILNDFFTCGPVGGMPLDE